MAGAALHNTRAVVGQSVRQHRQTLLDLVNDEAIGDFTLFNFDAGYRLPSTAFFRDPHLRFNVYNLFNTDYLYLNSSSGSGFTTRAQGAGASSPSYYVGAPRAYSIMLASDF
jgi:iron complex outermembrane receptor protein